MSEIWEGLLIEYPNFGKCFADNWQYKLIDCPCERCYLEYTKLGYRKGLLLQIIKNHLTKLRNTLSRDLKIEIVKHLFT